MDYDIQAPSPEDDVIEHQERVEAVIEAEIEEAAGKASWLTGYLASGDKPVLSTNQANGSATVPLSFTVDTVGTGHGVSAGPTPGTFHIKKGVYLIEAQCELTSSATPSGVSAVFNSRVHASNDGSGSCAATIDSQTSGTLKLSWPPQIYIVTADEDTLLPYFTAKGLASGNTVTAGGIDIVKIA